MDQGGRAVLAEMVRIVPDQYRTRDSSTVRALADDFTVRQPPGRSVEAIAPRFTELITNHAEELRRYDPLSPEAEPEHTGLEGIPRVEAFPDFTAAGVHVSEMTDSLRDMLTEAGLGLPGERLDSSLMERSSSWRQHMSSWAPNSIIPLTEGVSKAATSPKRLLSECWMNGS